MTHQNITSKLLQSLAFSCVTASVFTCALWLSPAALPQQKTPVVQKHPDFARSGRPFLEKYCIACHSSKEARAGLALDTYRDTASLVQQRAVWIKALNRIRAGDMPPRTQNSPHPSAAEVRAFTAQVETIFTLSDRNAPPNPGRVTMRRLNRVEYRNTIRDLVGVDFDPISVFPSDDIGYGFDNIGDVLTLSPVLMERYLAAAEEIMGQAIVPNPPPTPKRYNGSIYTEPASDVNRWTGGWRWMVTDSADPIEIGPIFSSYQWEPDGEYIFRTRVYGQSPNNQPIKVTLLVGGDDVPEPSPSGELAKLSGTVKNARILKTFTITAKTRETAETLEVQIPPMANRRTTLVALEKPAPGSPPVKLWVEYLTLDGPLETRPPTHFRLLATTAKTPSDQTKQVMERFLNRAFRRPPTTEELAASQRLVEMRIAQGGKWETGIQFAMQAALCSPKFLFRVELDANPRSPKVRPVDEFQLASRLSYFLWASMPDEELMELAKSHRLTANLAAQTRRMLASPKSVSLVRNFALQWLQLKRMEIIAPDPHQFPNFNNSLKADLLKETELFVASVFREDRSVLELIDANYTFLNEPLAKHYGIRWTEAGPSRTGEGRPQEQHAPDASFQRVTLRDRTRGGLLTQGSILAVTSNPTRTSPVKRGKWVLEQILGTPPPPPPPKVPDLPETEKDADNASLRTRMEQHRRNPVCANCHTKMDSLGFALENFDAVGAYRTRDGKFPIDATGQIPGGAKFTGPGELKTFILGRKDDFVRCLTEKLMTYGLGRGLEYYDRPVIDGIVKAAKKGNYKFSVLVVEIVKSDPFRKRRGL